jgi:hypothetical protein
LKKTEDELRTERMEYNEQVRKKNKEAHRAMNKELGTHEFLIKNVGKHIKTRTLLRSDYRDFQIFNANIWQLKELRTNADYADVTFSKGKSEISLDLSRKIMIVLQKY